MGIFVHVTILQKYSLGVHIRLPSIHVGTATKLSRNHCLCLNTWVPPQLWFLYRGVVSLVISIVFKTCYVIVILISRVYRLKKIATLLLVMCIQNDLGSVFEFFAWSRRNWAWLRCKYASYSWLASKNASPYSRFSSSSLLYSLFLLFFNLDNCLSCYFGFVLERIVVDGICSWKES